MAGYSLVQVGSQTNLSDGTFANLTYGCDNFEGVLLKFAKASGTLDASPEDNIFITILAGTETICNRVPMSAFASINQYEAGTGTTTAFSTSSDSNGLAIFEIDTGCWYLDKGAELTVQVSDEAGATHVITLDVFAKVNGIQAPSPQQWNYRTDNAFMLPLVETLYAFGTNAYLSTDNVTLQYGTENVLVPIEAGGMLVNADSVGDALITNMSICYDGIPREMQINTTASGVSFLAQCKVIANNVMVRKARRWIPNKFKSLSPKERVVLAQGH